MIFWQINTRTPQRIDELRGALERERDHFMRTQNPDTFVKELSDQLSRSSGPAKDQISKALNAYLATKPTDDQYSTARDQIEGAIIAACDQAAVMTRRFPSALVQATLCGHADDGRADGVDQRVIVAVDFAPMPRMDRAASAPTPTAKGNGFTDDAQPAAGGLTP